MSSEYGWTTEYILTRTLREISWRILAINHRKRQQAKQEAAFRGVKIDDSEDVKVVVSKEQEAALELAMQRAQARKRANFNGRSSHKN